jgi:calcineurin-like phosphoesterase family protein
MKYYIITDTHFDHDRIIDFCNRSPDFEGIIINNLKLIPKDTILIHLGDFAWYNHKYWHDLFLNKSPAILNWLIIGNHDKHTNSWYYDKGWDFVGETAMIKQYGKRIMFSHKPLPASDLYDVNVHGHLHNTGHHETYNEGKHICCYIEHHYKAQDLKKLIGM